MNRWNSFAVIAVAALVAGAAVLVYARQEEALPPEATQAGSEKLTLDDTAADPPSAPGSAAEQGAAATEPPGQTPQVLYDLNVLPNPVKRTLNAIIEAAESGDIERMRPVLESNELKPMVSTTNVDDPIEYWKKASADGMGRDVLAAMLNVLASGFVRMGKGENEMYVWPYFAETNLALLTPAQEVELYRIMSPSIAVSMKQAGKYSYYRLGISPEGVWHYFLQ
jgi:hypothetical protein